ncbi:MAG: ORF6N domain-containing protein [Candidatus Moranbacteria bacterium]|nr:ORF6N domain-containing protein [Candidatus Moranbacteria bacterium]
MCPSNKYHLPDERVVTKIFYARGKKVILDSDIANFYGVETKVLNQAVKRNVERFPEDFMFVLTKKEMKILRSQFVTSSPGWGGRRYQAFVFTEQGVAMLSSVLKSKTAIQVNIQIIGF